MTEIRRLAFLTNALSGARASIRTLLLATSAATLALHGATASAQGTFPSKPVQVVVPFAAGTSLDIVARIYARLLSEQLGGPVIVDPKPGAGSVLGTAFVARAPADGYTLLLGSNSALTIAPNIQSSLDYTLRGSFVPIVTLFTTSSVMLARKDLPANTLGEVVALAKASPGAISYASYGVGTIPHISMAMLESRTGTQFNHIPYKGGSEAGLAVAAGQVDVGFETIVGSIARLKTGKVKPIAVLQDHRAPGLPDVPTTSELGFGDINIPAMMGIFAPKGTPAAVVKKLSEASAAVVKSKEFEKQVQAIGAETLDMTPEALMSALQAESDRINAIVKKVGIKAE
ncbi:tripartite tricarboxylate transporter substrate binding protein [Variovorax sp.]|uniref:Bug family tripartite tricarboxylate transporter substrate binding protein n=1 Tax=Variovorax sp. TaxID=1871043 RepID=UPI002D51B897|nr:tripartite tricarboxylate transporter substrate binding protein [Variovorax sp.]HYP84175.1 tripartite tricarboxylate transporter substrate binding protein [Variovorax sp.]